MRGLDEIEQAIRVVCGTQLGSVPQLREYGIDWLEILDLPAAEAIPLTLRRVAEALKRWVPRAEVRNLAATMRAEHVVVSIAWGLKGDGEIVTEVASP